MSTQEFLLPDVGEGLTEAEIVAWHVAVGDVVEVNQVIVEIETAKSVVELPSPYAGVVETLRAAVGATVPVGQAIIGIRTDATGPEVESPNVGPPDTAPAEEGAPALLVGYGARETAAPRRRRSAVAHEPTSALHRRPRAKPPVRKLAKDLGIDLHAVVPTGPDGTITRDDVLGAGAEPAVDPGPTPGRADGEERIPIKGVRKLTAAAMVSSAFTAPHVTEFVTLDVTPTLELREKIQQRPEFREVRLTPLAFVARAYLRALSLVPMANARWDEAAQEIVIPSEVNLGIAAATPRGLVVPHVRAAQRLGLLELSQAINDLARTARAGRTPPEAMAHGTTTITNVGVFGVDTGTPILNPGETAILAVGAIRRQPWVVGAGSDERIEPRSVLQLSLSFDHRVIDGQQGSELLAHTAALLAEPGLAVL